MHGDDRLSLLTARQLTAVRPLVQKPKPRGAVMTRRSSHAVYMKPKQSVFLLYETICRFLLADEERRVASPEPKPVLAEILKIPAKAASDCGADWGALDEVPARQDESARWGLASTTIPIDAGSGRAGQRRCRASDSHPGHRHSPDSLGQLRAQLLRPERSLVSVANASLCCVLVDILHTSEFGPGGMTFVQLAPMIQTYWNKNKGVPLEERWYRTLADDKAGPKQWLEAAHEIIRPSDETGERRLD